MKLAVSTWSLYKWRREQGKSFEQSIDAIADQGAAAVEFAFADSEEQDNTVARAEQLRRHAEKRGLEVAGYCVGAELLRPPAEQARVIEQTKRRIDVAVALGAPSMRHDITRGFGDNARGLSGPQTFEAALDVVVPAIRELTEYGQSKGIITTLENHGFFMQESTRIVEKLIQIVNHPNFRLTLDMGNFMCVGEDPVDAVARLVKYAVIVHAKDFHVHPKTSMPPSGWFATPGSAALRGAIVGHGVIDVPRQLRLVRGAGYDGFLSLEFEGMEDPLLGIRLGLEYLRSELAKIDGQKV